MNHICILIQQRYHTGLSTAHCNTNSHVSNQPKLCLQIDARLLSLQRLALILPQTYAAASNFSPQSSCTPLEQKALVYYTRLLVASFLHWQFAAKPTSSHGPSSFDGSTTIFSTQRRAVATHYSLLYWFCCHTLVQPLGKQAPDYSLLDVSPTFYVNLAPRHPISKPLGVPSLASPSTLL